MDVAVGKPGSVSPQVVALDRKVREGLDRAEQLVDGFLELGWAEHGELPDRAAVALDQVIAAVIAEREPEVAAKRITIDQRLSATTVSGSPTLLSRMVDNVIEMACATTSPMAGYGSNSKTNPTVPGSTIESGGPTLDPHQVGDLAQPFRRLGAERTGSQRGAGLGLSIVAAIVAAHARHAEARCARAGRAARRDRPPARSVDQRHRGSAVRMLVVEDERGLADDIAEGLRDHGIAVDVAYDGLDAAAKVNLYPYDVIVLDRDLPGLHGDSICRLVADTDNPAMILMLTAAGSPSERVAGLQLGADDYLAKPFHFPELVLRIHALARRKPDATDRILRAAGIELDPARRTATRDGRSLDLSAKEFAVLHALLQASPGALTAEQLLLQAWDENIDPFTRTVYVTIARLKSKLGDPPPIQSAPGLGYSITTHR